MQKCSKTNHNDEITLKGIIHEDVTQYKVPSMVLLFPYCDFKCERDSNCKFCHNSTLTNMPNIKVNIQNIINWFMNNPITSALVLSGLEPLDSFKDVIKFIKEFRNKSEATIVIYTGYKESEIPDKINQLAEFTNIIVKFGRFIPNSKSCYDDVLGVVLASDNQYGKEL